MLQSLRTLARPVIYSAATNATSLANYAISALSDLYYGPTPESDILIKNIDSLPTGALSAEHLELYKKIAQDFSDLSTKYANNPKLRINEKTI